MKNYEWPLNEPIETKASTARAIIYEVFEEALYGRIGCMATSWNLDGSHASDCYTLVPPKPKVRSCEIRIRWDDEGAIDWILGSFSRPPPSIGRWTSNTIPHPDDVKPIRAQEISRACGWTDSKRRIKAIIAMLKEHGVSVDENQGG